MFNFNIDAVQEKRLDTWIKEQNVISVAKQRESMSDPTPVIESMWEQGFPYGGAAGGSLTYMFTPTSLGICCKVTDAISGGTIDLTRYDMW